MRCSRIAASSDEGRCCSPGCSPGCTPSVGCRDGGCIDSCVDCCVGSIVGCCVGSFVGCCVGFFGCCFFGCWSLCTSALIAGVGTETCPHDCLGAVACIHGAGALASSCGSGTSAAPVGHPVLFQMARQMAASQPKLSTIPPLRGFLAASPRPSLRTASDGASR